MRREVSNSVEETCRIAKTFAKTVKQGDIVCLEGDLGAGKTHFVKGFVEAFGVNRNAVTSPTFTIINEYDGSIPIYHFDCYRLESIEEALEIGAEEYLYGVGVCIIEWPERIQSILPKHSKKIIIKTITPDSRELLFQNC
jgi:tRNA threonylcarbamoyladenosine biosynthesis protein TsaE